ncbi:carboxypepD_reg-like domain-containing protein [Elysia marginata]|uniref:CarboxypepD_reg-like domain-containing protein n=1 Tax=Elysia marginata TaxID=1093978 RepID=A0AAV4FN45_9GAST|nr:carboxypepD_reg-like domain-containing protein [Elysia marginata]
MTVLGEVVSNGEALSGIGVINMNKEVATKTDITGKFIIDVSLGDKIAFFSKNYQYEVLFVTKDIVERVKWRVELEEKMVKLDEVVLTNAQKESLKKRNEAFKRYYNGQDYHTKVVNIAGTRTEDIQYGLDFANIYRALRNTIKNKKGREEGESVLTPSVIIRGIYPESFFVEKLGVPKGEISVFLFFCEQDFPDREILKKQNEFQLLDYLIKKTTQYKALRKDTEKK